MLYWGIGEQMDSTVIDMGKTYQISFALIYYRSHSYHSVDMHWAGLLVGSFGEQHLGVLGTW